MSIQKAVEYIGKAMEVMDEYDIIDEYAVSIFVDELIRGHLYNAIHELKTNKELGWETVEKCECGKDSVCKLPGFDVIPDRYFCKDCFFKQPKRG